MGGVEDAGVPFEGAAILAKLFRHGGSQAVRLPKAFRFEGEEVTVRRVGDAVILEPVKVRKLNTPEAWDSFWAEMDASRRFDFPEREQPSPQERDLTW